jgi:ABC-type glycerol-3-phosphate transport system substrate-binding protein
MKLKFRFLLIIGFALGVAHGLAASEVRAAETSPSWKETWEKTTQGAKREGELRLYCSEDHVLLFAEFQKKYPDIKLVTVSAR